MITSAENKTGAGYVQSFSLKSSGGATFHQFIILQQVLSVTHILCRVSIFHVCKLLTLPYQLHKWCQAVKLQQQKLDVAKGAVIITSN